MIQALNRLFKRKKRRERSFTDVKQEALIRVGREQFKKILDKGLSIPVAGL